MQAQNNQGITTEQARELRENAMLISMIGGNDSIVTINKLRTNSDKSQNNQNKKGFPITPTKTQNKKEITFKDLKYTVGISSSLMIPTQTKFLPYSYHVGTGSYNNIRLGIVINPEMVLPSLSFYQALNTRNGVQDHYESSDNFMTKNHSFSKEQKDKKTKKTETEFDKKDVSQGVYNFFEHINRKLNTKTDTNPLNFDAEDILQKNKVYKLSEDAIKMINEPITFSKTIEKKAEIVKNKYNELVVMANGNQNPLCGYNLQVDNEFDEHSLKAFETLKEGMKQSPQNRLPVYITFSNLNKDNKCIADYQNTYCILPEDFLKLTFENLKNTKTVTKKAEKTTIEFVTNGKKRKFYGYSYDIKITFNEKGESIIKTQRYFYFLWFRLTVNIKTKTQDQLTKAEQDYFSNNFKQNIVIQKTKTENVIELDIEKINKNKEVNLMTFHDFRKKYGYDYNMPQLPQKDSQQQTNKQKILTEECEITTTKTTNTNTVSLSPKSNTKNINITPENISLDNKEEPKGSNAEDSSIIRLNDSFFVNESNDDAKNMSQLVENYNKTYTNDTTNQEKDGFKSFLSKEDNDKIKNFFQTYSPKNNNLNATEIKKQNKPNTFGQGIFNDKLSFNPEQFKNTKTEVNYLQTSEETKRKVSEINNYFKNPKTQNNKNLDISIIKTNNDNIDVSRDSIQNEIALLQKENNIDKTFYYNPEEDDFLSSDFSDHRPQFNPDSFAGVINLGVDCTRTDNILSDLARKEQESNEKIKKLKEYFKETSIPIVVSIGSEQEPKLNNENPNLQLPSVENKIFNPENDKNTFQTTEEQNNSKKNLCAIF